MGEGLHRHALVGPALHLAVGQAQAEGRVGVLVGAVDGEAGLGDLLAGAAGRTGDGGFPLGADRLGRDYAEIEKTSNGGFRRISRSGDEGTMTPDAAIEQLSDLAAFGIDTALIGIGSVDHPESRELVEREIIPAAASMPVAGR